MRSSIATVSLGGTLREKLEAAAGAGFEGVEIFEADILAHDGSPADVGRMVRDLGLEIVAFQPFRDFEGMPEPRRARGFERARRKFALMNELGAPRVLVCSNVSPHALGGIDRAAADLRELGQIAAGFGVEVGFEALAWGVHIRDYRDAWEVVRRADHPSVGIILDSYHTLAPGYPLDPIRSIPADRISFVQVADAPKIDMDLLQLSRHFRCFPGQGDLDITGFMAALGATGYDGWLSHEIFNDRFRMASPRQIARDGERSIIAMTGRTRGGRVLPAAPSPEGVAFIEFAVSEAEAPDLARLIAALGFHHAGQHRAKDVAWWRQGDINLVINTETDGFAHSHYITHGPSVAAIGLWVSDAGVQMDRAEALLAQSFRQPVGPGELEIPAIRGVGGALIYFLDRKGPLGRVWEVEFEPVGGEGDDADLTVVDHIAQSVFFEELPGWRLFYRTVLSLGKTPQVDVVDPAGLVESEVLHTADRALQIALNASQARQTQSSRFINEFFGAGVQHIAFATGDIFEAARRMRAAGFEPLPIPENYYDDLEARFDLEPTLSAKLRALDILYDEDEHGAYYQVYTRVFADRFFFEVVCREGYRGFGAPNAPIRLAAQARLSRHPAVPRR
ncbi:sugar phosphate isomerase/epimerase and 4-hydroxyphenylpyruvate domain-containing protein [Limibaculum sp. FT325]|uniref:bifunctional sugar phosphate isomerase/epimerase/4-hydroxyphenylpyruvate dioxygenase family protein n=1 Tax=Thermohalobaculum sediminis TaxID=2939436 RepID=UPI0020C10490|nr:sugar phosphate isomerase/epimerase and 4-hydroxyphenylpyruvate domain-containing protein [Limibaculum sediminis]MCL5778244.1 sugar phosphate isomerase/epimerase and 4-hydroxyphenylpyruvate domain-containing protein [Limibaculum sediminis]